MINQESRLIPAMKSDEEKGGGASVFQFFFFLFFSFSHFFLLSLFLSIGNLGLLRGWPMVVSKHPSWSAHPITYYLINTCLLNIIYPLPFLTH